ncbi:MAG: AAA family ATPase [Zoogloeaceae bacterium]|jgi:predicted ATP-binding protein involved in virulence|nr:AAA family ATPase [Zoogloeaceae bacterium]
MQLDKIHLKNYRAHTDLTVEFNPHFNVLVGVNGSGKTSLLHGICASFYGLLLNKVPTEIASDSDVRHCVEITEGRYRFELQYPLEIVATGKAFDKFHEWKLSKTSELTRTDISGNLPSIQEAVKDTSITVPLVVFYPANRKWSFTNDANKIQSVIHKESRKDAYTKYWNASENINDLQSWVIAKCLERWQTSSETGELFDNISGDELGLVNQALHHALEDIKGLRYDMKQKSLLVEWQTGVEAMTIEHLSDGQRAIICLVVDIARRMCILNPQLGQEVTEKTPGIVLIDELDMHLHPEWQRRITRSLKTAFPAVQFIVASHSPQVIGELRPEEIILLTTEGMAHPQTSYGLDSSKVLEEIMGASPRTESVQKDLDSLSKAIAYNKLGEAKKYLNKLQKETFDLPELLGAQALIQRKEVLGK